MPILWRDDTNQTKPSWAETALAAAILVAGGVLILGGFVLW